MQGSFDRKARMSVLARLVLVMATLIPAAKQRQQICTGIAGIMECRQRPKAAPAAKKGKMYPPRKPPATVNEMAMSLRTPTRKALKGVSISKPRRPEVGNTFGKVLAGCWLAIV